ncbi:MAG TPA: hypothetical protein VE734_07750 [Terriglobales bacterium]|nr:hypothetical protein [Terriglobales bacterium]
MTLLEAIRNLDSLDKGNSIHTAEQWRPDSPVVVVAREPAPGGLPAEAEKLGLKYFLELFIAREFLQGWTQGRGTEASPQEQVARLIRNNGCLN